MNKVTLIIKRLEYGRSEVTFKCEGDIYEWCKKNKKKGFRNTQNVFNEILYKEVHGFYYDTLLDKFVKRFDGVVDEIVTI